MEFGLSSATKPRHANNEPESTNKVRALFSPPKQVCSNDTAILVELVTNTRQKHTQTHAHIGMQRHTHQQYFMTNKQAQTRPTSG